MSEAHLNALLDRYLHKYSGPTPNAQLGASAATTAPAGPVHVASATSAMAPSTAAQPSIAELEQRYLHRAPASHLASINATLQQTMAQQPHQQQQQQPPSQFAQSFAPSASSSSPSVVPVPAGVGVSHPQQVFHQTDLSIIQTQIEQLSKRLHRVPENIVSPTKAAATTTTTTTQFGTTSTFAATMNMPPTQLQQQQQQQQAAHHSNQQAQAQMHVNELDASVFGATMRAHPQQPQQQPQPYQQQHFQFQHDPRPRSMVQQQPQQQPLSATQQQFHPAASAASSIAASISAMSPPRATQPSMFATAMQPGEAHPPHTQSTFTLAPPSAGTAGVGVGPTTGSIFTATHTSNPPPFHGPTESPLRAKLASAERAASQQASTLADKTFQLVGLEREVANLRGKLATARKDRAEHAALQQEHAAMRASLERSEKIRREQLEYIQLLHTQIQFLQTAGQQMLEASPNRPKTHPHQHHGVVASPFMATRSHVGGGGVGGGSPSAIGSPSKLFEFTSGGVSIGKMDQPTFAASTTMHLGSGGGATGSARSPPLSPARKSAFTALPLSPSHRARMQAQSASANAAALASAAHAGAAVLARAADRAEKLERDQEEQARDQQIWTVEMKRRQQERQAAEEEAINEEKRPDDDDEEEEGRSDDPDEDSDQSSNSPIGQRRPTTTGAKAIGGARPATAAASGPPKVIRASSQKPTAVKMNTSSSAGAIYTSHGRTSRVSSRTKKPASSSSSSVRPSTAGVGSASRSSSTTRTISSSGYGVSHKPTKAAMQVLRPTPVRR